MAHIKLSQPLDYETKTHHSLVVRVENENKLAAETIVDIEVIDVNDNIPVFCNIMKGSVPENEQSGSFVLQVQATDADGTEANNQVLELYEFIFLPHVEHLLLHVIVNLAVS